MYIYSCYLPVNIPSWNHTIHVRVITHAVKCSPAKYIMPHNEYCLLDPSISISRIGSMEAKPCHRSIASNVGYCKNSQSLHCGGYLDEEMMRQIRKKSSLQSNVS